MEINTYTQLYIKQILWIAQGSLFRIFYQPIKDKNLKKDTHTHTYKTESLCCTPKTSTTL